MGSKFTLRRRVHSVPDGCEEKENNEQKNNEVPRRSLRSNSVIETPIVPKPKVIEDLPFISYKGEIVYCTNAIDISLACDRLLGEAEKAVDFIPLAFDMEWPFSFKTGPGKSALIQVCYDINICYLFQISELSRLPGPLTILLKHPKVRCHGVNIKNDFRKLERDYKVDVEPMINNCIDLGVWYNEVTLRSGRWSLARLVAEVVHLQINKDKSVRMSQWNVVPLSANQQLYAAIDVYIGQVIYYEILKQQQEFQKATEGLINGNDIKV